MGPFNKRWWYRTLKNTPRHRANPPANGEGLILLYLVLAFITITILYTIATN